MRMVLAAALMCAAAPALAQAQKQDQPVIHMVVPLPALLPEEQAQKAPDLICILPTTPTGSRVAAPKVCKTAREWNELYARGLDIGTDGKVAPMRKSNDVAACGLSCK